MQFQYTKISMIALVFSWVYLTYGKKEITKKGNEAESSAKVN